MIKTVLKETARPVVLSAFNLLAWTENKLWPEVKLHYSPTFIVAPPRAGTTLLYQMMTRYLPTCYFANLIRYLYISDSPVFPILVAQLTKTLRFNQIHANNFDSYYGATRGLAGPDESNMVWEQSFPEYEHAIPAGYLSTKQQQAIYRYIAGVERIFERPFINKCINNSVRIEAVAEIFPTAIFVQCVRNPLDVAQSIYFARTRDFPRWRQEKDPMKYWFSVRPKEYPAIIKKGLVEQVCEQVYFVEQAIATAKNAIGSDRFISVHYNDLCHNPHRELNRIVDFMNSHNAPVQIINNPLPDSFPYSTGQKIDQDSYLAMANHLSQLYGKNFAS